MSNQRTTTLYRSTVSVVILLLLSKFLGFLRQAVIAGVLGSNTGTDIYFISSEFFTGITGAVTQALVTTLVTVYLVVQTQQGKSAANAVASRTMTICALASGALTLLVLAAADPLAYLLAPGYSGAELTELAWYLRAFSAVILLTMAQAGYIAVLNAENSFLPGKLYGIFLNPLAILAVLIAGRRMGIAILIPITYAAQLAQLVTLMLCCRHSFRYRPVRPQVDEGVKQVARLMLPITICNVIMQVSVIGGKAICSLLGESMASSYSYAYSLEQMVTGTFTAALGATVYPMMAQLVARDEKQQFAELLRSVLTLAAGLLVLVTVLMILSAEDVVTLVYMHGAFTEDNVRSTALALCGFALGFPVVMGRELLRQVHFAFQAPRITMVTDVIAVAVCIAMAAALSRFLGVLGVAAAVSLGALCSVILLCWSAKRKLELPSFRPSWREIGKYAAALAAGGLVCALVRLILPGNALLRFLLSCIAGCAVCGGGLLLLRAETVMTAVGPVINRLRNQ